MRLARTDIPNFTDTIIPHASFPLLKLMAGIGLSLFLFLVGLETDTDIMAQYLKKVVLITLPGMAIPFGIAIGISRLIYEKEVLPFTAEPPLFTTFFLFIATTMAVTSLSVLSRIMAEMGILSTTLGAITIASGVANDLIGYVLLALGSALGTGGKQINALYMILAAAGYILALWFGFRPIMQHLLWRSGFEMDPDQAGRSSSANKVPPHLLVIAIAGALTSAFYTDAIGVHPIVGAFAFGVCCPHGPFAVQVTEAVETLVMNILLPLYFVTSGLSTDFKLLNTGVTWGLIFLMLFGIFASKFGATALAARAVGLPWRRACCVASLMQSKGIIEIIILNVGRDIGVVSPRVFAMLVLCFLCTTMLVRPLSRWIFFSKAQEEPEAQEVKQAKIHSKEEAQQLPVTIAITSSHPSVAAIMSFLQIAGKGAATLSVDLVRLVPQDDSNSTMMRLLAVSTSQRSDAMLASLKMHAWLCRAPTSLQIAAQRAAKRGVVLPAGLAHGFTQHHSSDDDERMPSDTFPLPSTEMVSFVERCNRKAQARLEVEDSGSTEIGQGLALVAWSSLPVAEGESWLKSAAHAAGVATVWLDNDPQTLPNRLFAEAKGLATGVLLDPTTRTAERETQGEELVEALGLAGRGTLRKPRVIVPFFGGSDDRAAVELLQRITAAGEVDAIVIVCGASSTETGDAVAAPARLERAVEGQLSVSEQQDTVHLQTVHHAEAGRADVRFLFSQVAEDAADPPAKRGSQRSSSTANFDIRTAANGVRFVQTQSGGIAAAVKWMTSLLSAASDFAIVGRGKLGQRPKDFRHDITAMYNAIAADRLHVGANKIAPLSHEAEGEFKRIGRSLGSVAEGLLVGGLQASMLVIQAKQ